MISSYHNSKHDDKHLLQENFTLRHTVSPLVYGFNVFDYILPKLPSQNPKNRFIG